jgi:hypothetical protein
VRRVVLVDVLIRSCLSVSFPSFEFGLLSVRDWGRGRRVFSFRVGRWRGERGKR